MQTTNNTTTSSQHYPILNTGYMTKDSRISHYLCFPDFLFDLPLNDTAKLVYLVLLDRARLSQIKEGWTDDCGRVFLIYPIHELSQKLQRCETVIKQALAALESANLICRVRQAHSRATAIYVLIPVDRRNSDDIQTENRPFRGRNNDLYTGGKPSASKSNTVKTIERTTESKTPDTYGHYRNVFLTEEEIAALRADIPNYRDYVERLSTYMESTGKSYHNHAATIRNWAGHDGVSTRFYDQFTEEDNL